MDEREDNICNKIKGFNQILTVEEYALAKGKAEHIPKNEKLD